MYPVKKTLITDLIVACIILSLPDEGYNCSVLLTHQMTSTWFILQENLSLRHPKHYKFLPAFLGTLQ